MAWHYSWLYLNRIIKLFYESSRNYTGCRRIFNADIYEEQFSQRCGALAVVAGIIIIAWEKKKEIVVILKVHTILQPRNHPGL